MNHKTNKYTIKLLFFLNNNLKSYYELIDYKNNKIIKFIKEEFDNIKPDEIKLEQSDKINKIHEYTDRPLMYIIMNELNNDGLLLKNKKTTKIDFKKFVNWYRENHSLLDIRKYLHKSKKYNTFYELLYKPPENRKELHRLLYDNMFVSLDVLHHAESENLNYKLYKNKNTEVHMYVPENDDDPDINLILKIFSLFRSITKQKNKFIKLVLFYGRQKKLLPMNSNIMCPNNVNSGATTKGLLITIWRKEEFYKVLIHELIHYFDLDFYVTDSIYKKIDEHMQNIVTIKGVDRVNESYTEILAITIHSIVYASIMNIDFNKILSLEILYSCFQFAKIFNFFGYDSYNLEKDKIVINQSTSVWSYYIIKSMFLLNYDKMLNFWENNGFSILGKAEENYEILYKDITQLNQKSIDKINGIIEILKRNDKTSFVINTMRMSLHQL